MNTHRWPMCLLLPCCLLLVACPPSKEATPTPEKPTEVTPTPDKPMEAPPEEAPKTPDPAPPKEEVKAPPAEVPAQVDGANLSVESMVVDGFSTRGLSCKLDGGGGLLGGPLIVGVVAKEKDALRACAPTARAVRVGWVTAADGALTEVAVADAGEPAVAACVAEVLGKLKSPSQGRCVITLDLGPAQP